MPAWQACLRAAVLAQRLATERPGILIHTYDTHRSHSLPHRSKTGLYLQFASITVRIFFCASALAASSII